MDWLIGKVTLHSSTTLDNRIDPLGRMGANNDVTTGFFGQKTINNYTIEYDETGYGTVKGTSTMDWLIGKVTLYSSTTPDNRIDPLGRMVANNDVTTGFFGQKTINNYTIEYDETGYGTVKGTSTMDWLIGKVPPPSPPPPEKRIDPRGRRAANNGVTTGFSAPILPRGSILLS